MFVLKSKLIRANALNNQAADLLNEAWKLLDIAYRHMGKNGLRDEGDNCSLPHETRMFALHFSDEDILEEPGMRKGAGTYRDWRKKVNGLWETLKTREAGE